MNRRVIVLMSLFSLAACAPAAPDQNAKNPPTQAAATTNGDQCQTRAKSRMALFDRPDTYPISDDEKRNAFLALYNQCMREFEVSVASPKPQFEYAAANDAGLASLAPAAGGNNANATSKSMVNTLPNGVMVIDTSQLANLNPAAGGNGKATGVTGGNGSTVVVVQAPPSTAINYTTPPTPPTHAAAIPVTPVEAPVATPAAEPAVPAAATAPVPVKKKTARRTTSPSTTTAKDGRTRFERNAVPVDINLSRKDNDLNALQPSAGKAVDSAILTNRPAPKD